jgi:hypothetical protein
MCQIAPNTQEANYHAGSPGRVRRAAREGLLRRGCSRVDLAVPWDQRAQNRLVSNRFTYAVFCLGSRPPGRPAGQFVKCNCAVSC